MIIADVASGEERADAQMPRIARAPLSHSKKVFFYRYRSQGGALPPSGDRICPDMS